MEETFLCFEIEAALFFDSPGAGEAYHSGQ